MSLSERTIEAPPERIDAVLRDGWNYADWVVGAVHIRAVDPDWPAPGSRVHHQVGAWPLTINDVTEVTAYVPSSQLVLRAHLWPFGEASVGIEWAAIAPDACQVQMVEQFVRGPALAMRNNLTDVVLRSRNNESLIRLEHLTRKYRG
jgi:hypothetical protein